LLFRVTKSGHRTLANARDLRNELWKGIPKAAFNFPYEEGSFTGWIKRFLSLFLDEKLLEAGLGDLGRKRIPFDCKTTQRVG
jgi:hypothetical protein